MHADMVVSVNADGQHDPNGIPKFVGSILKSEADVCVGYRMKVPTGFKTKPSIRYLAFRNTGKYMFKALVRLLKDMM